MAGHGTWGGSAGAGDRGIGTAGADGGPVGAGHPRAPAPHVRPDRRDRRRAATLRLHLRPRRAPVGDGRPHRRLPLGGGARAAGRAGRAQRPDRQRRRRAPAPPSARPARVRDQAGRGLPPDHPRGGRGGDRRVGAGEHHRRRRRPPPRRAPHRRPVAVRRRAPAPGRRDRPEPRGGDRLRQPLAAGPARQGLARSAVSHRHARPPGGRPDHLRRDRDPPRRRERRRRRAVRSGRGAAGRRRSADRRGGPGPGRDADLRRLRHDDRGRRLDDPRRVLPARGP
jgi:hypothetical protein